MNAMFSICSFNITLAMKSPDIPSDLNSHYFTWSSYFVLINDGLCDLSQLLHNMYLIAVRC